MSPYIINVTQNIGGNKSYFSHHTTTTFCLDYRLMQIKLVLKLVLCVSIILKIYVKGNVVIITTNPTFQKTFLKLTIVQTFFGCLYVLQCSIRIKPRYVRSLFTVTCRCIVILYSKEKIMPISSKLSYIFS